MSNAKVNFKIQIKAKGTIAVIIIVALVVTVFLYIALNDTGTPTQPPTSGVEYIGNQSTKRLHLSDCRYVSQISENNVIYFSSVGEATGFGSCSVCTPK